jgi:hypothetical protein
MDKTGPPNQKLNAFYCFTPESLSRILRTPNVPPATGRILRRIRHTMAHNGWPHVHIRKDQFADRDRAFLREHGIETLLKFTPHEEG